MAEVRILEIDPLEAQALLDREADARLIDVRSKMEFDYVGHPPNALHVVWKEFPHWEENTSFTSDVQMARKSSGVSDLSAPVLMLCRSGARSKSAGERLLENSFVNVYNVLEGFEGDKNASEQRSTINGWRFRGLDWVQG